MSTSSAPGAALARLQQRALAVARGEADWQPPMCRAAATVAVLREGPDGMQVLLQRRAKSLAFAAGMHVFPGGTVDPADEAATHLVRWPTAEGPGVATRGGPGGWSPTGFAEGRDVVAGGGAASLAGLMVCAVRETLEESGLLLARSPDAPAEASARPPRLPIDDGPGFAAAMAAAGLLIDAQDLIPVAHWLTPAVESRRFDTRFFVARAPLGQTYRDDTAETDGTAWIRPALALAELARGRMPMLPPTAAVLRYLADFTGLEAVFVAGAPDGMRPILPHPFLDGADLVWRTVDGYTAAVLPGDPFADARPGGGPG